MSTEISKDIHQNQLAWKNCIRQWPEAQIEWFEMGEGDNTIVAFPGYGNDPRMFRQIYQALPENTKLQVVQLPGFGKSHLEKRGVVPDSMFWARFISDIAPKSEKINLVAYSIGARFVSAIIAVVPEKIDKVILLAPAGFGKTRLFNFAVYHPIGKKLFSMISLWGPVLWVLLKISRKLKLISERRFKFMYGSIDSKTKLKRLVNAWVASSVYRPDVQELREKSIANGIKWHVIWGTEDNVLPFKLGEHLKAVFPEIELIPVNAAHHPLKESKKESLEAITRILNDEGNKSNEE